MKATVITHYEKKDKKFNGDFVDIEVFVDGSLIATFGDQYHERGKDRAEGFLDGFQKGAKMPFEEVKQVNVADRVI